MTVPLREFSDLPLPAATSDAEFELYKAALEWQLASPIVIRSGEDILSRERWHDRVQPFHHQVRNLITFCRLAPAVLLADEVGLGKTISAGLILSELSTRRRVGRALVVCPRMLCDQWTRELADKFRIEATVATGAELLKACNGSTQVVVTTYETAGRYLSHDDMPTDAFQMLILDEAHRLRNLYGANRPPQFTTSIRDALEARWFTYILMLTATPIQNRFTDIYSLVDLLTRAKGHQNPFGGWQTFRKEYLLPGTDGRQLQPHRIDEFRELLNGYVVRTRRVDAELPFPSRQVETIRVTLSPAERNFEEIVGPLIGDFNPLTQSSLGEALMSSPAALAGQLERMAKDRPKVAEAARRVRAVANGDTPPAKLERLLILCEELSATRPDWRVVVFTRRRETQDMIRKWLVARKISVGLIAGGRPAENRDDAAKFLSNPPLVHVLISTDAGAEGINLQGANWLVNYDLPWNPMLLEQRIGRIQRLGSLHREVFVQNLVAAGTVEELVVARLMQRLMMVAETVGDLESILVTANGDPDDDSGEQFQAKVRDLVIRSLQGQDSTRAAEQLASSIERARQEYDLNCAQMNQSLGTLDGSGDLAPPPPTFERRIPSMSAEQFARQALLSERKSLIEIEPDLLVSDSGEKYALTPAASESKLIDGQVINLYAGQPAFERLVQRWARRRCHRVTDLRGVTDEAAEKLARQWIQAYPEAVFTSCFIRLRRPHINGQVLIRASAENRVDQHQRLVEQFVAPAGHRMPIVEQPLVQTYQGKVSLQEVSPRAASRVRHTVADDEEINLFHRYYLARRTNELSRVGNSPHLRQRLEDDLTVNFSAEVVGFCGFCYEEAIVDVTFTVSNYEYTATLQAVPALGQILEMPTEEQCPITGLKMPFGILGRCERSKRLIPVHLLYRSAISDRLAAVEYIVHCEVTNLAVLDDEVEECAVTGKLAASTELVTCSITQQRILRSEAGESAISSRLVRKQLLIPSERPPYRLGLAEEIVRCSVTGHRLLIDEVAQSAVSGRTASLDLLIASERSGRLGLANEAVLCQNTERLLLIDEVDICSESGRRVDTELLTRSEISNKLALREFFRRCSVTNRMALERELEACQSTGELVFPDQLETCVLTNKRMIRGMMARCEITNDWLSPDVVGRSDVSGRTARPDLIQRSERPPHRAGLPDEVGKCEVSGKLLLKDEMSRSIVSNRLIDRELLVGSGNRLAHPSECVTCEETGERLLPYEAAICTVTGRLASLTVMIRSEESGKLMLPSAAKRCSVTNRLVAPDELDVCGISGEQAVSSVMETCPETNLRAIRRHMTRCSETGKLVAPNAIGRSDYSSREVIKRLLRQSDKPPGRWGTQNEFGRCEVSGKTLLFDELERCIDSHKLVDRDLLVTCGETGERILKDDTYPCAWLGKRVRKDLMGVCELTRIRVSKRFLDRNKMLRPLADLLDGKTQAGMVERADIIPFLRETNSRIFNQVLSVKVVNSNNGEFLAVCAAVVERRWFTSSTKYAGFVISVKPQPRIMGSLVLGDRDGMVWTLDKTIHFTP